MTNRASGADPTSGQLSREAVAHVARLARLEITEEESETYAAQLSSILEHVEAVRSLDTAGVPPTSHALELRNVLRDDEPRPSLPRDDVLAGAPSARDGRFVVPRILGEES